MTSNASIKDSFRLLLSALKKNGTNKPDGWWDTTDIQILANYSTATAASNKAKLLHMSGLLERMPYRKRTGPTQTKMSYAYRPTDPKMDWDDILEAHRMKSAEKVPAGWICVCDFARKYELSLQAIFQMVKRYKIPTKIFKVKRGLFGLKRVYHYPEKVLCRKHRLKLKP